MENLKTGRGKEVELFPRSQDKSDCCSHERAISLQMSTWQLLYTTNSTIYVRLYDEGPQQRQRCEVERVRQLASRGPSLPKIAAEMACPRVIINTTAPLYRLVQARPPAAKSVNTVLILLQCRPQIDAASLCRPEIKYRRQQLRARHSNYYNHYYNNDNLSLLLQFDKGNTHHCIVVIFLLVLVTTFHRVDITKKT